MSFCSTNLICSTNYFVQQTLVCSTDFVDLFCSTEVPNRTDSVRTDFDPTDFVQQTCFVEHICSTNYILLNKCTFVYHDLFNNMRLLNISHSTKSIQNFLTSVIIGATSMEQLKIDIESVNVNLTDEIIKRINDVQIKYPNPCP